MKKVDNEIEGKEIHSKADIVGETYKEILDTPISGKNIRDVSDEEIKQADELINPDPNSMDSRG